MIDGLSRSDCYVRWLLNRDMLECEDRDLYLLYELTADQITAAKRYESDCPNLPDQEK